MTRRHALLAMASCLVLAGCARPPRAGMLDVPTDTPYTLSSGDRLRIIVFGQENLSNIYAVDASGQIAFP
jgi:polysaccharide export outer membrane protein